MPEKGKQQRLNPELPTTQPTQPQEAQVKNQQPESLSSLGQTMTNPSAFQMNLIYGIMRSTKIDCNCEVCQVMRDVAKRIEQIPQMGMPPTP